MRLIGKLVRLAVVLVVVLAVAGGGLIVYLQNADLGPLAIKLAKQYGGVDVAAQGPVSLKLFPNPEIHAGKLSVVGPQGGKPLFEADKTDVVMKWGSVPVLWKGMMLENVSLQNPVIYLHKPKTGTANWEMPSATSNASVSAKSSSGSDGGSFGMALGQANITNLNATYIDETTGRNVNVKGLNVQTDAHDLAHTTLGLKGTINSQPLEALLNVDASNLNKAPIKVALALANLKLNAQGEIDNQQSYRGDINVQSPDIHATYMAALGTAPAGVPTAPLSLTGHVALGGDEIDLSAFALKMGDLLNAGGELAVKTGDKPSAKGTLQVQGNNLRALVALATGTANASIPASAFSLQTTLAGDNAIKLTNISAQLTNIASLGGNVTVTPRAGKAPLAEGQINLRAASARALGAAFGVSQPLPAQPLALSTSFKGGDDWSIPDLTLSLGNLLSANVKATVTPGPVPLVNGSLDVSGNDMKATAAGFGVVAAQVPSSKFAIKADIAGDKTVELKNLSIDLPNLAEATGTAQMTPPSSGAPGDVKANLDVKRLDLTALGPCAPSAAAAATQAAAAQGGGAAGTGSPFNSTPIDLAALKSWTFNFDVDVANLSCARWPVTTFKGNMVNTADKLSLNNVSAALAGGSALVNGSLSHSGTPALALVVTVKNVPIEKFAPTLAQKGVQLPVNLDANITSSGASSQALASALKGTLAVNATSGKIPYTNLLGGMTNVERLLNGSAPASNGDGKIEKFVASYDIAGGDAKTKEFNLTTDGAFSAIGTGDINIGAWSINYTLTPQVAASNQIAVPVLIKGSLSAPSIGPDPAFINKLTGRLATQGLKLLNAGGSDASGAGAAVGNLLSGQGISNTQLQKGLGNLLKGLGK